MLQVKTFSHIFRVWCCLVISPHFLQRKRHRLALKRRRGEKNRFVWFSKTIFKSPLVGIAFHQTNFPAFIRSTPGWLRLSTRRSLPRGRRRPRKPRSWSAGGEFQLIWFNISKATFPKPHLITKFSIQVCFPSRVQALCVQPVESYLDSMLKK